MTDVFFPDRSQYQGQTTFRAHACVARATEGDWLTDTAYAFNEQEAAGQGAIFQAYHFLESGSPSLAQAQHCLSVVGKDTPLMLDLEPIAGAAATAAAAEPGSLGHYCGSAWHDLQAQLPQFRDVELEGTTVNWAAIAASASWISKPGVDKAVRFTRHYRALGGICHTLYLPHWYWQVLGSPDLKPVTDLGMVLVSSDYTTYSDTGPGWQPYGGKTPTFWQYTDTGPGNQDWNAYKSPSFTVAGAVKEIQSLWHTGSVRTPSSGPVKIIADGKTTWHQYAATRSARDEDLVWETAQHMPSGWGPGQRPFIRNGNWGAVPAKGTIIWVP